MPAFFNLPGPGPLLIQRLEPLDPSLVYTDADTAMVVLTASGTEFPAKEYTESATVLVDIQVITTATGTLATDPFTYSNGHLAIVAANWSNAGFNGLDVSGNLLVAENGLSDGADVFDAITFPADQFSEATLPTVDTANNSEAGMGVVLRATPTNSDPALNMYRLVVNSAGSNNVSLAKWLSGSYTLLAQYTASAPNGTVVRLEAAGTTLRVIVNSVLLGSVVDASIASGYPGVAISSAVFGTASIDDWSAGSLSSPADIAQFVDSATVLVDIDASGTDTYVPPSGTAYTDADTALVDIQASGTELREITDADIVLVDLQSSGTEFREITDTASVLVDIQASGVELQEFVESATVLIDLQSSGTELQEFVETATPYVDIQASGTEILEAVEVSVVYLLLTVSAVEQYQPPATLQAYVIMPPYIV